MGPSLDYYIANLRIEMVRKNAGKHGSVRREVAPEVFGDKQARNQLANAPEEEPRAANRARAKAARLAKEQRRALLYGTRKNLQKTYNERDLGLPVLNRAVLPGVRAPRGKKGKTFIDDHDTLLMSRLVKSIGDKQEQLTESRLERSQRLEEIRDLKRQEMERREAAKKDQLEDKKAEIRRKASLARSLRRKTKRNAHNADKEVAASTSSVTTTKKRKKVAFA